MGGAGDIILIKKRIKQNKKLGRTLGPMLLLFAGDFLSGTVERYLPLAARVRAQRDAFVSGNFAGFSLYIINFVRRISAAAMEGAGAIYF
jgi:hypothetical protein